MYFICLKGPVHEESQIQFAISLKFSFVNLLEKGKAWCFGYLANKQTNKHKEIKTNFLDNNKRLEKKSKRRKNEKRVNCDS